MADAGRARGKQILVVNDAEEIVELFRDVLEPQGHRVSTAIFGPDDLAAVKAAKPDLVILDLMMGGEPIGWALLQKMKLSPDTTEIPVIVCTAAVQSVREQEGWLAAKGVKVVLKPFSLADLEQAIEKVFDLPTMMVQAQGGSQAVQ